MASDEVIGRDPFMAGPGGARAGRVGVGSDPLASVLRITEAWLRAAVQADPRVIDRARAEVARRVGGSP